MLHNKHLVLICSLMIIFLSTCKKDEMEPELEPGLTSITINISGTVIDESGSVIASAQIDFGGNTTTTNANGIFILQDVPASEERNYLKVNKEGYFYSGRNFYVSESGSVNMKIILLPRVLSGIFMADVGGSVETSEGLKVDIPANSMIDGYQGEVRVYSRYIDPSENSMISMIPGLEGIDQDGELGVLQSFGMGHIELEDVNGNELDLADGSLAEITMPIPDEYAAIAESSIPLWYFDEVEGIWKEDGLATLIGDEYVGEVSHFTTWNCDKIACPVDLKLYLNCAGADFTEIRVFVQLAPPFSFLSGMGYVNEFGYTHMIVPCSSEIFITAFAPQSSGLDTEYPLGSVMAPNAVGSHTLVFNAICGPYTSVSGQVVTDTMLTPVNLGYIYMNYLDFQTDPVFLDDDGRFQTTIFDFSPDGSAIEASITAWDMENFATATGPNVPFNNELNELPEPIIIGAEPFSFNGRIFVTDNSADDFFFCLDASDGSLLWQNNLGDNGLVDSSPAFLNGKVYAQRSSYIYCLNSFDGSEIWNGFMSYGFSSYVEDNTLYATTPSGGVRSVDALTGDVNWIVNLGAGLGTAPVIDGDLLFTSTGTVTPGFAALNKNDGSIVWEVLTPDFVDSSPAVVDGRVFYGCNDQELYARDAATGDLLWQATFDDVTAQFGCPTVGNGMVYIQSAGHIRAFDVVTGAEQWEVTVFSTTVGANPYLYENKLIARTANGPIYCYNALDGSVLYEIGPSGVSNSSVVNDFTVVDGVLFMHRNEAPQTIQAYNVQNGQLLWTSPVEENMSGPIVVVDDQGVAHYSTISGMQQ